MMRRRTLMTLPGAMALAAVQPARAQAQRVARIGSLRTSPPSNPQAEHTFMEELRARGWVEGDNLQVIRRYTEDRPGSLRDLVAELLAAKVDVITVPDDSAAAAVRRSTATTPIVFSNGAVPVEIGLVASLARPGGNVTGVVRNVAAKQIELARSMRPDLKRLAVAWFPADRTGTSPLVFKQQQEVAAQLGVEVVGVPITRGAAEWDTALAAAVRSGAQMFTAHLAHFVVDRQAKPWADWAIKHRIIVFGPVEQGFLMSYAADPAEQMRSAARLVDRILRGTKPADLPVEQARIFRLRINARTAKAMGLTVPKDLLARADEVIE